MASCWSHCSHSLILHAEGCTGQIKCDWRWRQVTSFFSDRSMGILLFQSFNAHIDFSQGNVSELSCRWTPATCYAGVTAVGLRSDLPPPSSSFRTYRASLCWELQVGTLFQIPCSRRTMHTTLYFCQQVKKEQMWWPDVVRCRAVCVPRYLEVILIWWMLIYSKWNGWTVCCLWVFSMFVVSDKCGQLVRLTKSCLCRLFLSCF